MTSASLSFAEPDERTRVLPYCHRAGTLTSILGLGCDAPPLAKIQNDNPLSWQIVDSFLAGTDAWKTVGHSPSQDRYLWQYGGVLSQPRDNVDRPMGSIQDQAFVARPPRVRTYSVVIQRPGPQIAAVYPSAARLDVLSLAPRMLVSIYGSSLSNSTVTVNGQVLALNYSGDQQINALLPGNELGLATLTVSNDRGKQTVNIWLADAAPAIFTRNASGTGVAAAIRSGDYVSLYLTGLGMGVVPDAVTLDGAPLNVIYAGPAPGFPGLDQINVQLPPGTSSGVLLVFAGKRASNAVTLP
jgi:uncharacterized protein (TIGR03437 family)